MLRARLFGGLAVWVDDRRMPEIGGVKPRSVLAYLLLNPGPHPRSRLAGRFWPDVLETSARGSLRSALWAIRAALDAAGGAGHLVADRLAVALDPGPGAQIDALEVARLLDAGDPASLERAVLLGAEPLLPDVPDEWAMEAQERHRERMIEALAALAAAAEAAGDPARALAYTRRALDADRLREPSHRALMRGLAAAGDRAGALAAYARCRDTLATELGVPPSAATRDLAEEIRAGATVVAPPAARPRAPAPPAMVGRAAELERLRAAWRAAAAGAGGVVLLEGAAGVGKSRLAAELAGLAEREGHLSATGHALDIDEGPPFGPWADALRQLVRTAAAPAAGVAWPDDLARLCPAVEGAWGRRPGAAALEPAMAQARLFEAVAEALDWCARTGPVLVVLEDLHRADPSSLALLAHLALPLRGIAALVVGTARTAAGGDALERARDALARRGGLADEIALGALPDDDILRIVRREAPGLAEEVAAAVAAAADGNPLLARQAARAAAAGVDPEDGLRGTVRAPLARLSPPARELVAAAAAAGRALTVHEALAVTGAERLDEAAAEGVACGLLDPAGGAGVGFAHDLVRRACYGELPPARRRAAHARLAAILGDEPSRAPAEVAHHLRAAGDQERARSYLAAAAASARALGALDQAAGFLRESAASAAEAGSPAAAGEAWLGLAEIEAWRNDRAAMDAAFARAREAMTAGGDVLGLASALAERARWLRTTICYPDEALRSSREALDLLDDAGLAAPETRLLALAGLAWGEAVAGDPARARELIGTVAEALGTGDAVLRVEMLLAESYALVRAGHASEASERSSAAADAAAAAGRPALALDARMSAAACAAAAGRVADVLAILSEPPDPARTGPALACQFWAGRAYALSRIGRHDDAVAAAMEEMRVARRFGNAALEAAAAADAGLTLLAGGRHREAGAAIAEALASPEGRVPRAMLRLAAAEAAVLAGDLPRARDQLERFPFEPVRPGDDPVGLVARLDRATGLLRLAEGRRAEGVAHLEAAESRLSRVVGAARPPGATGEEIVSMMIDLGRPPVAGLSDHRGELARVRADLVRARAAAVAGAAAR
ncbi:AAA family ATPase [Miltoncostaea marina]|uniref:AAA family ATPase n=1 Tax=Miltoncostaea marina TaxID=2843215 RepID=UPI001C3DBFD4|nr:AAA family ATPase [Miltoncostaea marina]